MRLISRFQALAIATGLIALLGCSPAPSQVPTSTIEKPLQATPIVPTKSSISPHLLLGNPSGATPTKLTPDNYLMVKNQYALSYNQSKGTANWVAWQLNKTWLGDAERQNNFRPDSTLPNGWVRITPSAYTGSGYDKGQIAPSGDRSKTSRRVNDELQRQITRVVCWRSMKRHWHKPQQKWINLVWVVVVGCNVE